MDFILTELTIKINVHDIKQDYPSLKLYFLFQTYVQDLMKTQKTSVYNVLVEEKGHVYVCGDVTMAADVMNKICDIISELSNVSETKAREVVKQIKVCTF